MFVANFVARELTRATPDSADSRAAAVRPAVPHDAVARGATGASSVTGALAYSSAARGLAAARDNPAFA